MTEKQRQKVYDKYKGHCAYCGKELTTLKEMQVDHKFPKCRQHFYKSDYYREKYNIEGDNINSFENLMPACRRCNYYKSSLTLEKFREQLITLIERCKKIFIIKLALDYGILKEKKWDGIFYFEKEDK